MSVLSLLAADPYNYSYNSSSADEATNFAVVMVFLVVTLLVYLLVGFFLYRVFKKAGRPGWAGFVPFYNMWVLFEISGKPGWWALLIIPSFIPLVGLLFSIALFVLTLLASLELAKRFGKSQLFGILGLWIFSIVGYAILAFDSSKYRVGPGVSTSAQPVTSPPSQPSSTPRDSSDNQNPPTPPGLVQ